MAIVEVENVSKWFPHSGGRRLLRAHLTNLFLPTRGEDFVALKDVSFRIEAGESIGVIGRNGAGKSTLLSLVAGVTEPSSGRLKVNGRVAALLELGAGFHPDLSGKENLFLNASLLGLTRRRTYELYDKIVDFSGIGDFLEEPLRTYSAGMSVRLAFSVAVNMDTDLLLVDEVLAVGDGAFQAKCLDRLEELRSRGQAMLFVSHSAASVRNMCERAIWLDHGEMVLDGEVKAVLAAYEGTHALNANI